MKFSVNVHHLIVSRTFLPAISEINEENKTLPNESNVIVNGNFEIPDSHVEEKIAVIDKLEPTTDIENSSFDNDLNMNTENTLEAFAENFKSLNE